MPAHNNPKEERSHGILTLSRHMFFTLPTIHSPELVESNKKTNYHQKCISQQTTSKTLNTHIY